MTGKPIPESAKPVPVTDAPLMVSATVPDEVSVTDLVTVVFSASVPKETLVALRLSAEVVAFRATLNVFDVPPEDALSVAVWLVVTALAVAVKPALVAPAAMVTEAGTATALSLLDNVTVVAALAAAVSDTVQASVPAPVSDELLQESEFRLGVVLPLPDQKVAICITHPPFSFRVEVAE